MRKRDGWAHLVAGLVAVATAVAACSESAEMLRPLSQSGADCASRYLTYGSRCGSAVGAVGYNRSAGFPEQFEDFLDTYCFGGVAIGLEFFNHGDLGLGRQLRITRCGAITAVFVANFGEPGQPVLDGLAAVEIGESPTAVVMTHDPYKGSGYETQFAVYTDGRLAAGLEFDDEGFKFSPYSCTACHGGRLDEEAGLVRGAYFLPLTKQALVFGSVTVASQETLRETNELVYDTYPGPRTRPPGLGAPGILEAIYQASGGVRKEGATQQSGVVLGGWQDQPDVYQELFGKHCQMCHQAQPAVPFNSPEQVDWELVRAVTCSGELMPNAQQAHRAFVTDTNALRHACPASL